MDTISKLPYEAEIFIKSKFLKAQIVEIEKSENIFKIGQFIVLFVVYRE